MSEWTHELCEGCWDLLEPGREVVRVKHPPIEVCCRCGALNTAGIYYRAEPEAFVYCDHDQGFPKSLHATIEIQHAHIENLIERVYALENNLNQEEI